MFPLGARGPRHVARRVVREVEVAAARHAQSRDGAARLDAIQSHGDGDRVASLGFRVERGGDLVAGEVRVEDEPFHRDCVAKAVEPPARDLQLRRGAEGVLVPPLRRDDLLRRALEERVRVAAGDAGPEPVVVLRASALDGFFQRVLARGQLPVDLVRRLVAVPAFFCVLPLMKRGRGGAAFSRSSAVGLPLKESGAVLW